MSDVAAVRWMEVATELVLGPLAGESIRSINAIGELLLAMTERDLEAVEKGERWVKRQSQRLTVPEARKALLGLTIDQVKKFADRWGYGRDEVISGAMGYGEIPHGLLVALGDVEEMAKITGETR